MTHALFCFKKQRCGWGLKIHLSQSKTGWQCSPEASHTGIVHYDRVTFTDSLLLVGKSLFKYVGNSNTNN